MSIVKPQLSSLIIGSALFLAQNSSSINATEFDVRYSQGFTQGSGQKGMKSQEVVFNDREGQTIYGSPQSDTKASPTDLRSFIQDSIKRNPLPQKSAVQDDLLDSGMLLNIGEVINQAYEYNPDSLAILGGLYLRGVDIDNAKCFLFHSAGKNNAEAFWLLSSIYRANYLPSPIPNLDTLLLLEADKLGSPDARRYQQENEF